MLFQYQTMIQPAWIDYNGHMQDAYYGLIFSFAVDSLQDDVGFDQAYRSRTGCTIYLLECHTHFLQEVKVNAPVVVDTRVLGVDAKRFHLHSTMTHAGVPVAVCEKMELHVQQNPTPHAAPMPDAPRAMLQAACLPANEAANLKYRAKAMGFIR